MEYKHKFRTRFLLAVLIVLAAALCVSTAVLVTLGVRQNRYHSAIKSANHYFTTGDYQNAIAEYENAISIDKKKETAYLNLASVYMNLEEYDLAMETVERGLNAISSDKLTKKKVDLQYLVMNQRNAEVNVMTVQEIEECSAGVTLENNVFDMVADYTYTEYFRDYGNVSAASDDGKLTFYYVNDGFETVYYDVDDEKVIDTKKNVPYAGAKPVEVSFRSLYKIFTVNSERFAVSYTKLQELFGDSLGFYRSEQSGMYYIAAEYKGCRIYVETDENGNIIQEDAWNRMEPLNRTQFESDGEVDGEVKGYVQDAMTGKGMKANMKVRGRGKKTGAVIDEFTSGNDGSYTYGGKQGSYTIEVSAQGYVTEYLDVEIIRGQIKTGKNVVLSPVVEEGEIRIVLTWGSSPTDLDSYAIGKSSSGSSFNINYTNKNIYGIGNLDVDDTSSYGPETITITDTGASFEYSVMDFRAQGTMGGSAATVKVYLPGEASARVFTVPSGSGLLWNVFKYENGEITEINQLTSDVPASKFHIGGR